MWRISDTGTNIVSNDILFEVDKEASQSAIALVEEGDYAPVEEGDYAPVALRGDGLWVVVAKEATAGAVMCMSIYRGN